MSKEKAGGELQRVFWRASGGVWQRVVTALVLGIKCDCGVVNGTMEMWLDRWYNHLLAFALIFLLNLFHLSLREGRDGGATAILALWGGRQAHRNEDASGR